MAKHRKTRKEKVISEKRRTVAPTLSDASSVESIPASHSSLFSLPVSSKKTTSLHAEPTHTNSYQYLTKDLVKTTILTFSIIAAEIILAFTIKI